MESPLYRLNLEELNEKFPNKNILKIQDIAKFEGRNRTTVWRKYPMIDSDGISKAEYAQLITIWNKLPSSTKRAIRKIM